MNLPSYASAYAERGIRVLPCVPGTKRPLISNWPERASADPAVVERWWTSHPNANIGILTGQPGFDVLDVDVRSDGDGFSALERLQKAGLLEGEMGRVHTPSGGLHLYFLGSSQARGKLANERIDFQATGGYVIAPPSRLANGEAYEWLVPLEPACRGAPLTGGLSVDISTRPLLDQLCPLPVDPG